MSNITPPMALSLGAADLKAAGYAFSVLVKDDEVQGYLVSPKDWSAIADTFHEQAMLGHLGKWSSPTYRPVLANTAYIGKTLEQLGWLKIGPV